jgi:hypothetical protein
MAVTYTFSTQSGSIPLAQLDANFATPITIGNTSVQLGNTITTLNNITLANTTISGGNVTLTNVSVTTANVTTANITNAVIGTANVTTANITSGVIATANITTGNVGTLTLTNALGTASGGTGLTSFTSGGVVYASSTSALSTGSALVFNGTNLGVGTSSPAAKLDVSGGSIRVNEDGIGTKILTLRSNYAGLGPAINVTTTDPLLFLTDNTVRMTLDSSGNLLVGQTGQGPANSYSMCYGVGNTGGLDLSHISGSASGTMYARFNYNATTIGSITQSGTTAVLYNVTSDQRLKENIQDADSSSSLIDSLQVRQFDWKTDNTHQRYGFVAQEIVSVAPEAVHQPADPDEMMAVDYSKLVPMLVKEIQSLRIRIAQLEAK